MSSRKPRTTLGDVLAMKGQALPTKGVGMEILAPPPATAEVLVEVVLNQIAGTTSPAELSITEVPADLQSPAEVGDNNTEEKPTVTSDGRRTDPSGSEGTTMSILEMLSSMSPEDLNKLRAVIGMQAPAAAADAQPAIPQWLQAAMAQQQNVNAQMLAAIAALQKGQAPSPEAVNPYSQLLGLNGATPEQLEQMGRALNPMLRGAGLAVKAPPSSFTEHLSAAGGSFADAAVKGAGAATGVALVGLAGYGVYTLVKLRGCRLQDREEPTRFFSPSSKLCFSIVVYGCKQYKGTGIRALQR